MAWFLPYSYSSFFSHFFQPSSIIISQVQPRSAATHLDDGMQAEHRPRILRVRGQGHTSVGRDAEVLTRGHVTEPDLLLPSYHFTCKMTSPVLIRKSFALLQ